MKSSNVGDYFYDCQLAAAAQMSAIALNQSLWVAVQLAIFS